MPVVVLPSLLRALFFEIYTLIPLTKKRPSERLKYGTLTV
uniref:Uncharacterized protein n=1 Tax=CrAss-like virus sp. ctt4r3 TaxID=2823619 RepID=A0A8S5L774_9CAUD|nr:MAG TPA: hypothetical protein [CrAss-like virus sp. ctt4r3]